MESLLIFLGAKFDNHFAYFLYLPYNIWQTLSIDLKTDASKFDAFVMLVKVTTAL